MSYKIRKNEWPTADGIFVVSIHGNVPENNPAGEFLREIKGI